MRTEKEIRDRLSKASIDFKEIREELRNIPPNSLNMQLYCDVLTQIESEIRILRWMLEK